MHEYPITERIINMACKACEDAGGGRVSCVRLVCGEYSGFVPESIDLYFGVIAEGTLCDGAVLEIKRVLSKLRCPNCGKLFRKSPLSFACPYCGSDGEPTEIGKEFYVESVEIE